jgi:hypothetical protein
MAITNVMVLDRHFTMSGDEDCGVGLHCRECETGGLPIAYYLGIDKSSYKGTEIIVVESINALLIAGRTHIARFH